MVSRQNNAQFIYGCREKKSHIMTDSYLYCFGIVVVAKLVFQHLTFNLVVKKSLQDTHQICNIVVRFCKIE